ncbi:phosphopantetheinyl transferase [Xylariales sp. PMI_506]|nr:phosphopantetheinyl transferase [Xylariales sp. PMI_506]
MASEGLKVIQWYVDTRELWPEATKTAQLEDAASEYLELLTPEERTGVLKYYFVRDAKMSLASQLLKHFVVSKTAGIPWLETKLSRDANKKPVFVSSTGEQPVSFNVTHQAGIVALAAVAGYPATSGAVDVGTDVVCVSERRDRDHKMIREQGWATFIDMHADVFGREETRDIKENPLSGAPPDVLRGSEERKVDFQLRRFYALWCLREAYVKMTGEALLAPWLHDLNFRDLRAPAPGEAIPRHDIAFKGAKVTDANVCLRSLGDDYMTCTALRTPARKEDGLGWGLGPYESVDITSILAHAQADNAAM